MGWLAVAAGLWLAFAADTARAEDDTTVVIDGVVSNNAGANFIVGDTGSNNRLVVTNAGQLVNVAAGTIGNGSGANNNAAVVTGSGSLWTNSGSLALGNVTTGTATNNRLTIANGATVRCTSATVGTGAEIGGGNISNDNALRVMNGGKLYSTSGYIGSANRVVCDRNLITIQGANSLWDVGGGGLWAPLIGSYNVLAVDGGVVTNGGGVTMGETYNGGSGSYNSLIVTNGGRFYNTGNILIGRNNSNGHHYNKVIVTGPGSLLRSGGAIYVPDSRNDYNSVAVDNGGALYTAGSYVGNNASIGCSVLLSGGGLWDVGTVLSVASGGGYSNTMANLGGILQFTTATPAITLTATNNGNRIAMDGGTLSYRNIQGGTLPNLTNNWGTNGVGLFTWTGANRFRLVNCSATNSLAGPYVFANNLGSTNYAGLDLVDGTNAIKGPGIAFAAGSSLLVSNSVTSIQGGCTMSGGMTVNWHGTSSLVTVNGTLTVSGINTFTVSGVPLEILPMTLFTSASIGDSGGWVVYPGQYRVIRSGTALRLSRTSGTVIVVR